MSVVDTLLKSGAVAIVRTADQASCQEAAEAIVGSGLTSIEITLTTPGAFDVIASLAARKNVCVGVGTVLTIADVANAAKAGATFVVSPNTNPEVIAATKKAGLISIPGVATPSDVATALSAGADVLKLFPASSYGPAHLKALRDPFPGNLWCPTGGLSVAAVPDWFAAGANMVGLGGPLLKGGLSAIPANVAAFLAVVAQVREINS